MTYNDVANLTLISFIPPVTPADCSQNAKDSSCLPVPESSSEAVVVDVPTSPRSDELSSTLATSERSESSSVEATTEATTASSRR